MSKTMFTPRLILAQLVIIFSFSSCNINSETEVTHQLSDFKVVIENTDDGVKMQSLGGPMSWIELSFSLNTNKPQGVDENGMADLTDLDHPRKKQPTEFYFNVAKTDDGIQLKGIRGTAWEELSFTLEDNQKQAFDESGMAEI